VSEEAGEVEVTISDTLEPVTNALAGDASAFGRGCHGGTTPQLPERAEDVRHPVDLAGQRVRGENAFACLASETAREDDKQLSMP
jgi:hypothetical protein